MGLVLPPLEAYQVQHLPIVKAYADKIGLVEVINELVPTEMAIDPGTIVLGMILDTLSGRSPLYRLEEFFPHQDTALPLGKAVPPEALQDDTVGRVLERLYATGTMKVFTACAVRADRVFGFDKHYVHFDMPSIAVYGDYRPPEEAGESAVPFRITSGYSKDKRPDLKQCVLSGLCSDHAIPLWGEPEDGNASDKTVHNTVLLNIAPFLATHRVAPGAYIYVADAALVTEDNLAALGDTLFITRLPATDSACGPHRRGRGALHLVTARAEGGELVLIDTAPHSDNAALEAARMADFVLHIRMPSIKGRTNEQVRRRA